MGPLDLVQEVDGEDKTMNAIAQPESRAKLSGGLGAVSPIVSNRGSTRQAHDSATSSNISEFVEQSLTVNMIGDRYYAMLSGDRLLLFPDKESADRYQDSNKEDWENRPTATFVIYRHAAQGLLDEDALESSFTLLLQDNATKMK